MPEMPLRSHSEPDLYHDPSADPGEEECEFTITNSFITSYPIPDILTAMVHPDVKCYHCMQDIVGARFHCAICDSVDICSNCEAAGLPGNLESEDGAHSSSHITIKVRSLNLLTILSLIIE